MTSVVLIWLTAFVTSSFASQLNVQFSAEPTQFDPLLIEDGVGMKLSANIVATLFQYDGKGEREKNLVQTYSVSRDRKHYTFQFKKNLRWSDGKAFSADQFILAIKRFVQSPIKVSPAELFPQFDLNRTRAIDANTAEVEIKDPDLQFINWLCLPVLAPIRQDMIDAYQVNHSPVAPTLAAYEAIEYKREDHVTLRKNPNYNGTVFIDEVKIRFLSDEGALYPLMKSGGLDILTKVPVLQLKELSEVSNLVSVPVEAVTYLAFNTKKAPFNDLKNRVAVRDLMGLSGRVELAKTLKTDEEGAEFFLPAGMELVGFTREKTEAPKKEEGPLEFSIQSDSGSRNQTILEFLQAKLKDKLNWKVALDVLDWKTHFLKLKTDPDAAYRFGWQNPVNDPFVVYEVFATHSLNNFTGWSNSRYDTLVNELRQEGRLVKKTKMMNELEDILWKEVPMIPLLHQRLKFSYSKRVLGFRANPFGVILFREIRLADQTPKKT